MRRALKWLAALVVVVLVAFLVLRTPDTDRKAMIAKYGAPPSRFVELRPGLTVHYRDEGPRDAPAIVLLHGSNADLHTWDAWTAALTDQYRVVRFDQIGHGLTGADPKLDYSPANFAEDVGRMALDARAIGRRRVPRAQIDTDFLHRLRCRDRLGGDPRERRPQVLLDVESQCLDG